MVAGGDPSREGAPCFGVDHGDLDALMEIDAPDSPIVVGLRPPEFDTHARTIVDLIAGELQNAVLNLYPTWLPDPISRLIAVRSV